MAKTVRSAAQKRADAKRSRQMKGKRPSFMRKRAARRASRTPAPRRRRRPMTKSKNGGRRHRVRTAITPKRIAKGLLVLDGARRIFTGPDNALDLVRYHLANPKTVSLADKNLFKEYAKRIGPGAIEAIAGPKAVDVVVKTLGSGEPLIGKLANKKLMTI